MGRRGYPPEFRRRVLDLVESGRSVVHVARDLQISQQTIYVWRRQDRIDRGEQDGLTSDEQTRLRELERENARLAKKLAQAEAIIEIQKKVAAMLAEPEPTNDDDGSDS